MDKILRFTSKYNMNEEVGLVSDETIGHIEEMDVDRGEVACGEFFKIEARLITILAIDAG